MKSPKMKKLINFLFLFIFSALIQLVSAQEICNNSIDDDGDGLIDLNDSISCQCNTPFPNIVPNPSFEQMNCCPSSYSQMSCVQNWMQASLPTSDYMNTCGWGSMAPAGHVPPPLPLPSGNGFVGFINGFNSNMGIPISNYKEYVGTALNSPILSGTNYTLSCYIGFGPWTPGINYLPNSPCIITVYGNPGYNLPILSSNCPTMSASPGWIILGSDTVSGVNAWVQANININAPVNINTIVIGPPCPMTAVNSYYYMDDIVLSQSLGVEITGGTNFCSVPPVLTAVPASQANYLYQWYSNGVAIPGAATATFAVPNGLPTNYQVRIEDVVTGACAISNPFFYVNGGFQVSVSGDSLICAGDSTVLSVPPGYESYFWSTGDTSSSITVSQTGTYTVITNGLYCSDTASFTVSVQGLPQAALINQTVDCDSLTYTLTFSGNQPVLTYSLDSSPSQNNAVFSGVQSGTHTLAVTNPSSGCISTDTFTLTPLSPFSVFITGDTFFCGGNSLLLKENSGLTSYLWSNGSLNDSIWINQSGLYWVEGTDGNGCKKRDSVIISNFPQPDILLDSVQKGCSAGNSAIWVSTSGGTPAYEYSLMNQGFQAYGLFDSLADGNYIILVKDENNCRDSLAFSITAYPLLPLTISGDTAICAGTQPTLTASPGFMAYSWSNGSITSQISPVSEGNYSVIVTDSNGCVQQEDVLFRFFPETELSFTLSGNPCQTGLGDITLNVSNNGNAPYTYSLDASAFSSQVNFTGLSSGFHTAIVQDVNLCRDSLSIYIPSILTISTGLLNPESCFQKRDGSAEVTTLSGNPPYQYLWQGTGQSTAAVQNLPAGTYTVTVTDSQGCSTAGLVEIPRIPSIILEVTAFANSFCSLDNGYIACSVNGGTPPFQYSWNTQPPQLTLNAQQLYPGNYTLTVADANGCIRTLTQPLAEIPAPTALFEIANHENPMEIYLSNPEVHLLNLSEGASFYSWAFGDGTFSSLTHPEYTYADTGFYTIILTAFDGSSACPDTYSVQIHILPDGDIFIPTVFSPNGDGHNDEFLIGSQGVTAFELRIYDRWGKEIAGWTRPDFRWDGTKNGIAVPEGVYTYRLTVSFNHKASFERGGTVTLIR